MTTDRLTSIDNLENEVADLQEQLRDSLAHLSLLNAIPSQFAILAAESAALNAASAYATAAIQAQAEQLTHWQQAASAREVQMAAEHKTQKEHLTLWMQEASGREAQMVEQWSAFRAAAEVEQNQVMRMVMTTRQELSDRTAAREKLVSALDERMERMNAALANVVSDFQAARRDQQRLAVLLTVVALLALGLSVAASWAAFT